MMVKKSNLLKKSVVLFVSVMTICATVLPAYAFSTATQQTTEVNNKNLALNQTVYVSSQETDNFSGSKAVDGNRTDRNSRWSSNATNNENITVDLKEAKTFNKVVIYWEAAYAKEYKLQVSDDNQTFKDIATVSGKEGEVVTTFNSVTARYVRMQGVSRATGYGYSIYEFEVYNEANANKTILSQKLNEYKNFTTESNYEINMLKKAVTKGEEVFNNDNATQVEVEEAVNELDRCYWLVKAADLYFKYDSSETGNYEGYLTESIISVMKLRMNIGPMFKTNEKQTYYENIFKEYTDAVAVLEKAPENPEKVMVGLAKYAHENAPKEAGEFTIDEEWIVSNGKDKIKLTCTFENTGIHPISGKEKTKFTAKELETANITLQFQGDTKQIRERQPLNGSYENGFVTTVEVDPGWYIVYFKTKTGNYHSSTLGKYYTSTTPTPKVDKSQLQALYDEVKSYVSEDVFYPKFVEKLEEAKAVLENKDATQDQVNRVHDELEQRYWLCKVDEYVGKYREERLNKPGFQYYKYEASSVMDVLKVQTEARDHTNTSYPAKELKKLYDAYVEAEKKIVKAPEKPRDMIVGPTYDMINTSFTGHVTMEAEVVDDQVLLHIEYFNDGINPITGKEVKAFSFSQMKKIGVYLDYSVYAGGGGIKPISSDIKPLDGETDLMKGFQVDVLVQPGSYTVNMTSQSKKAAMIGTYYTVDIPKAPLISGIENNAYTNKDVTLTVKDENNDLDRVLVNDKEVSLDDLTFTQEGTYTVVAIDATDNETTLTFTIDKTAPEVVKVTPNEDGTVTVKFSEVVSKVEGGEWKLSEEKYEDDGKYWVGTLIEDKFYDVTATDVAGNRVEFKIDHESPKANIVYSITDPTSENVTVTISFLNEKGVYLTNSTENPGWEVDIPNSIYRKTFTENTKEIVHFHDGMDNGTEVEVNVTNIDREVPMIEGIDNDAFTNTDVTLTVHDDHLDTITVNGKEVSIDDLTFTKDGTYTVVVSDKAGNRSEITFTIDKKSPVIEGIENGATTNKDVTLTVDEDHLDMITVNGKEASIDDLTFTKDGIYTVVVKDKAANETSIIFTIKKEVKPSNPDKDDPTNNKEEGTQTGDTTNVAGLLALLGLAGIAITYTTRKKVR